MIELYTAVVLGIVLGVGTFARLRFDFANDSKDPGGEGFREMGGVFNFFAALLWIACGIHLGWVLIENTGRVVIGVAWLACGAAALYWLSFITDILLILEGKSVVAKLMKGSGATSIALAMMTQHYHLSVVVRIILVALIIVCGVMSLPAYLHRQTTIS